MENIFVSNGTTQLVLVPESEVDRVLLERMMNDQGTIELDFIRQPISILGKSVQDAVIIRRKPSASGNDQD